MRFVPFSEVKARLRGKTVAIVGSGPSSLMNEPGFIDSHDVVIRVNNYKTGEQQGRRCDIFYSFFGGSIRKHPMELIRDGVKFCMAKCPNSKPLNSEWHEQNGKRSGIDFRYIYQNRRGWWWCDTFVPTDEHFLSRFELLGKHIPTTGFAAIMDVLDGEPAQCNLTGFDFFASGLHNLNEPWRPGRDDDPIGHRPDLELAWLAENADRHPLKFDCDLAKRLFDRRKAVVWA